LVTTAPSALGKAEDRFQQAAEIEAAGVAARPAAERAEERVDEPVLTLVDELVGEVGERATQGLGP
jgi:hypothetical protein